MALTAIVIGLAVTALLLALVAARRTSPTGRGARRARRGGGRADERARARGDRARARRARRGGGGALTVAPLALLSPWAAGAVLVSRRPPPRVGWLAVAVLAANAGGARRAGRRVLADGPVEAIDRRLAGRRRHHAARRRARRPRSRSLSSLALLAATRPRGARRRARARCCPALVALARRRADRRVPHRRPVQLLRLLRAGDDRRLRPRDATAATRRELGGALVFAAVNLFGTFVFLISVAGALPRHRHARHGADRRARWATSTRTPRC